MGGVDDLELGVLLVLLSRAHRSFRTLRAELRVWRHHERLHEAYTRRNAERRDGTGMVQIAFGSSQGTAPQPSESEDRIRLWLAPPDRLREEAVSGWTGEPTESLLVQVADTWWSFDPRVGAMTNDGSPRHQHGTQVDALMLDPAQLSVSHELRILGRTMHAGRNAIRVEALPARRARVLPEPASDGGWPLDVLVDAERGVLLRSAGLLDGEPFILSEVVSVAFDEALPDELFVFEAPPGEEIRDSLAEMEAQHRPLLLHEAAAQAPFRVFVPGSVPADWHMRAILRPGSERQGWPSGVHIHYTDARSRLNVNLAEMAVAGGSPPPKGPNGAEWRIEQLPIGELRLWAPSLREQGLPQVALIDIAGTRIQITAHDLATETLIELVASLVEAPTEPPAVT